jgi:hypothetical protein
MATKTLLQALAVCAELTNTELSEAAARIFADDLSHYPEKQVLAALTRCRREVRGRLTLAAVLERLDDGRPGPEEAWAMIPRDESASVVWTEEMRDAFATVRLTIADGELVPSRMAFLERYRMLVAQARDARKPPKWEPSLGTDKFGRERVLLEAVEKSRLSREHVAGLLPASVDLDPKALALISEAGGTKLLEGKR